MQISIYSHYAKSIEGTISKEQGQKQDIWQLCKQLDIIHLRTQPTHHKTQQLACFVKCDSGLPNALTPLRPRANPPFIIICLGNLQLSTTQLDYSNIVTVIVDLSYWDPCLNTAGTRYHWNQWTDSVAPVGFPQRNQTFMGITNCKQSRSGVLTFFGAPWNRQYASAAVSRLLRPNLSPSAV